jgi:hypothetical protein
MESGFKGFWPSDQPSRESAEKEAYRRLRLILLLLLNHILLLL